MYNTFRRLSRDNRARCYIGGSYETSQIIGKYKVQIDNEKEYTRILIWNPNVPCLAVDIDKSDNVAVLNQFLYDSKCTTDGKMQRGQGTREMMKFAFDLMRKYGATKVQLTDMSYFYCNGMKVNLSVYNLFKYGKTWYERCFQFYPIGRHAKEFEELRANIPRIHKPCEYFTQDTIAKILPKHSLVLIESVSFEKKL